MTIFSGHSVIIRVYTSHFGNGTARWNLDRSGTKKVSGTRYSTQWKTPQKWTVPYRTMQWKSAIWQSIVQNLYERSPITQRSTEWAISMSSNTALSASLPSAILESTTN